jgi:outer membrane protein OmpA-like peptidoglycan-associated protein
MKNYILLLLFFTSCSDIFGQTTTNKYDILIKKADNFYRIKNYKTSALTYSQAFKLIKGQVPITDRYNAACSWALAGISDSAFSQLNTIASTENTITYEQLSSDHDLKSLQKDKRWKPFLKAIKQNKERQEAKLNKPLMKMLDSIRLEDQQYRSRIDDIKVNYGFNSKEMKELWKIINEKDSINLIKVKVVLDSYGWLGSDVIGDDGNSTLFLVIQHSNQKTQEKYLPMMREAVKVGKAEASSLALLEDRVAIGQGKKQIYGSQIMIDPKTGKNSLAPVEDFANVDKRREAVGLQPLDTYLENWGIATKKKDVQQKIKKKYTNSDFETAIEIHDSIVGPTNVTGSIGKKQDIGLKGKNSFYEETNAAWFKFTIDIDTVLTFDIVPAYVKDDFDFVLFKCSTPNCIDSIRTNPQKADRYCFSVNYDKNGSTGLSEYATDIHSGAGPGNGYVSALPVKAGETFYLMVNWPYYQQSKGFTIYFFNFWTKKPKGFPKQKHIASPLKAPVILENILFENNKTVLLSQSSIALDKLVNQLQANKTIKMEVRGHTDNVGNEEAINQKLSEERAKVVVNYLVSKRIDPNRLSYKGLGSKQPIASNETEEGRQKNRRVEFIVVAR